MLDFDTMLLHVGEFGLYQKILFTFQAPFCMFVTFVLFGQMFMVLYPVNYWCEQHFACLTPDSQITAAQRRNISFAWRNDGIFFADPCMPNNINDKFLRTLQQFSDGSKCRDRRRVCEYNEQESTQLWANSPTNTPPPRYVGPPPQIQVSEEPDYNGGQRRKRQDRYGAQNRYNPYIRTTTTTPRYPPNYEGQNGWQPGNGDNYGTPGSGSSTGENSQGQWGNPSRPATGNDYNNGNDWNSPTTTASSRPTTTSGYYPDWTTQAGLSGSNGKSTTRKPNNNNKAPTDVRSAFAGWPEPKCNQQRFRISLSNNTVILSDKLQKNSGKEVTNETCTVRWNRSEIPYETIVSAGNWWCRAEMYTTIAQAVFFLGAIVGGFLIGWIADTFGRVPALVIANILGALGGALSTVSTNVWVFCVFRFITGMAFDNCFTMMYILVLEFCGPSYRTLVANLSIAVFYTLGTLILPLLAWLIADWRIYGLVISLPMLLGLLALFFVPESARWLLSKGRAKEATNILRNFAKVNRRKVDEKVFVDFEQEATKLFSELDQAEEEPSLAAAFRTPRLRRTFMLLIIFWSLIALVYDGHSRNIINLANEDLNVFWMFGIASMTEFPADMLLIFTLDRFGRRWLAFGSMTLSGAFSFVAAAITPDMRTGFLIAAIFSRFWVNVAFNIGLQYAAELLPTVIRAQGVNAIHIMGYVASIISPFVAAIGRTNPTLSLILLGGFALTAGFVSLFLAETLGEDLPNTLEEAEAFGKNQSFWNCPICAKERDYPTEPPPAAIEERPVVLRNALRGSIRGETYRSSMISHASSGGSRRSRYLGGDAILQNPEPTELTRLRRVTH